jgi:DtxR family Mn-dependent transcriptional regulator
MVRRLSEQGLLEHIPYRGVLLTAAGRRAALRMVRRHRLIEAYLVGFLGYSWDTVHDEAERLEHAVSDALIERMALALGNPRFDPHGDPIPSPDGAIDELVYTPLAEIPVGETAEIRRVDTSQGERLRYLELTGLKPGIRVTVLQRQPFHGPISLRIGAEEQVIGHELAQQVLCVRPEPR